MQGETCSHAIPCFVICIFVRSYLLNSKSGASNRRKGPIKHLNYMKSSSHHYVAACIVVKKMNFVFNSAVRLKD